MLRKEDFVEYKEYLQMREERRQKARAKKIYRTILLTSVVPIVAVLLIAGVLVMKLRPQEQALEVSNAAIPAYLYLEGSHQLAENMPEITTQAETLHLLATEGTGSEQDYGNGAYPDIFLVDGISGPSCVNIRSEAGITGEILGKLYVGAGGVVEKYDPEWCYINSGNVSGYVSTDYIITGDNLEAELLAYGELTISPKVTGEAVDVYAAMDAESELLGTLTEEAEVISVSKHYIGISYADTKGYVFRNKVREAAPQYKNAISIEEELESKSISASIAESESIEESKKAAELFDSIFTKTDDTVYAIDNVNIRASYSEDSKIIGYMFVGDSVKRTAKGKNGWDQVEYYGVTAYVSNTYISTKDPLATTKPPETTTKKNQTTEKPKPTTTKKPSEVTNVAAISLTEDEILMLAAMIYCEAGGESYEAQLAVANVILNRLRSGHWGNSLEDLLSARGQFSPYASGKYAKVLADGPNGNSIKVAKAAMKGEMAVPSNYMFFCLESAFSYRYTDYKQIGVIMFYAR